MFTTYDLACCDNRAQSHVFQLASDFGHNLSIFFRYLHILSGMREAGLLSGITVSRTNLVRTNLVKSPGTYLVAYSIRGANLSGRSNSI